MKITAYIKNNKAPYSLSNFMCTGNGTKADADELRKTIEQAGFNSNKIVRALNKNPYKLYGFSEANETEDTIEIKAIDFMMNTCIIRIIKEENEMEEKKMTVKEMRAEAKEMGIKGYSRMSKEDLQKAIETKKNTLEKLALEASEKLVEKYGDKTAKTVVMKAFTGMWIGEFEVIKETKKTITVATKKGELKFDKTTGIQLDANNPKFANHIELA